jgi:AcrR family transcriptional regulator
MRTHGWGGDPPRDDDEARRRILAVTRRRLHEAGVTRTAEVAQLLGVTRQTVYRYFPTTQDLLDAASFEAIGDLKVQLVEAVRERLAAGGDVGDAIVEGVAFVYEHLRDDPALRRLLAPGELGRTLTGITAPSSIALGGSLLEDSGVDGGTLGLDAVDRLELVEHLLRTLQSLILDPGSPPRSGAELRRYLQRWLAPVVRASTGVVPADGYS